jgi:DNA-binding transcriptional LysR family regulator
LPAEAHEQMHNAQRVPTDTLRAHAMLSFGQSRIVPVVLRLRDRSRSVKVWLVLSEAPPDLLENRYDAVLTLSDTGPCGHCGIAR